MPAFTVHDLFPLLQAQRAAVHEALQEHRAAGGDVNVPFDAVFICELIGLVVNPATGEITGWADERVRLRAPKSLVNRVPATVDGEVGRG